MNLPANISVLGASLPQTYQAAQSALAQCSQVDECKDWADKAAALASYAKQADDHELERMAQRIRARAIRRAGELLKQIEPQRGGDRKSEQYQSEGSHTLMSREEAARNAGMSKHQQVQATRVANIPDRDFDAQVDSAKPPTLSQLAAQGTKQRENIIDLKGRDPKEYNRALHYVADFEEAAAELEKQAHNLILPTLNEKERQRMRAAINRIDAITDKVATRI